MSNCSSKISLSSVEEFLKSLYVCKIGSRKPYKMKKCFYDALVMYYLIYLKNVIDMIQEFYDGRKINPNFSEEVVSKVFRGRSMESYSKEIRIFSKGICESLRVMIGNNDLKKIVLKRYDIYEKKIYIPTYIQLYIGTLIESLLRVCKNLLDRSNKKTYDKKIADGAFSIIHGLNGTAAFVNNEITYTFKGADQLETLKKILRPNWDCLEPITDIETSNETFENENIQPEEDTTCEINDGVTINKLDTKCVGNIFYRTKPAEGENYAYKISFGGLALYYCPRKNYNNVYTSKMGFTSNILKSTDDEHKQKIITLIINIFRRTQKPVFVFKSVDNQFTKYIKTHFGKMFTIKRKDQFRLSVSHFGNINDLYKNDT